MQCLLYSKMDWLADKMRGCGHTVSATHDDMDQNTRDIIMTLDSWGSYVRFFACSITTDPWLVVSVASKFHSVSMSVYRKKWKVRVFDRKGVSINFVTCDEMVMLFRSYITLLLSSYLSMLPVYCDWELRRPYYHQRRKVSCFERDSLIWFLTPSFLSQFTNIRERQTISMVLSFYFWVCRFKERRYNNRGFLLFEIPSLYMIFIAIVIQV